MAVMTGFVGEGHIYIYIYINLVVVSQQVFTTRACSGCLAPRWKSTTSRMFLSQVKKIITVTTVQNRKVLYVCVLLLSMSVSLRFYK